jgi:hypothetical protein
MHWTDGKWETHVMTRAGHNYDMGSLYVGNEEWRVIGPAGAAPQLHGTGGEMALWASRDDGKSWKEERPVTQGSAYNQSYARRPEFAADPFFAFWADGDPARITPSHLYFTDSAGGHVWRLPYDMKEEFDSPGVIR